MAQRRMKRVSDSRVEHVQIVMFEHINGYKRLFGGKLMEWIDVVAAVVARRHSGSEVTTALVDSLEFKEPAFANSTMILVGKMVYAGRTSMEVRVDTFVESLDGEQNLVNTAFLVMVALDDHNRPKEVPGLLIETEEEQREWEAATRRRELRKNRK